MVKKKFLGSTLSLVHGKKKEIICHDMRKYVWLKNGKIWNKDNKKKRPQLNWIERLTTDQEVRGSTPLGRTSFFLNLNYENKLVNYFFYCIDQTW